LEDEVQYDSDGYAKTLEKVLTLAEKEYYVQLVDINRHQVVVSRTILWLLVVLIGFDFALIDWFHSSLSGENAKVSALAACWFFAIAAVVAGAIAFTFAALAIPSIGNYSKLYTNSWADYTESAYKNWEDGNSFVYETELSNILSKVDIACNQGSTTNHGRGVKLRIASIMAIVSAALTCVSFVVFSLNFYF